MKVGKERMRKEEKQNSSAARQEGVGKLGQCGQTD